MIIKSAKFVISNTQVDKCPQDGLPEYAFIGRSNVGKSSLINMLTNHGKLAMISSKPGKTKLINHFIINDNWFLVDLPGYGYAKGSKQARSEFSKIITAYVKKRENLTNLFILVDGRHKPQTIDIEFVRDMGILEVPFSIIFTKVDKESKAKVMFNIEAFKGELMKDWVILPPIFISSSKTSVGRDDILNFIDEINQSL